MIPITLQSKASFYAEVNVSSSFSISTWATHTYTLKKPRLEQVNNEIRSMTSLEEYPGMQILSSSNSSGVNRIRRSPHKYRNKIPSLPYRYRETRQRKCKRYVNHDLYIGSSSQPLVKLWHMEMYFIPCKPTIYVQLTT